MTAILFPELQFKDNATGYPLASGTIETYAAGTSTPLDTVTDYGGLTSAGVVLTLDSNGRPNGGNGIFLKDSYGYKFVIKNDKGAIVQTVDNINKGQLSLSASFITAGTEAALVGSRRLTGSSRVSVTDAGPGSTITLDVVAGSLGVDRLQNIATNTVVGRSTAGTGSPEVLTVGTNLSTTGGVLDVNTNLDLSSNASLKIPTSTAPSMTSAGQIAIDTNTDNSVITHGSVIYHDGTSSRYTASFTTLPTTGQAFAYNSATKKTEWQTLATGGASLAESFLVVSSSASLTNERVLTAGSGIATVDGGANSTYTIKLDVNGLTEDTTPDSSNDYVVTYDVSAATNKKVKILNIPTVLGMPIISGEVRGTAIIGNRGEKVMAISSSGVVTANRLYYIPIIPTRSISIATWGFYVYIAEAAKNVRLGLYNSSASTNKPTGAPIFDSGSISVATTGMKNYSSTQVLSPGILYWLGICSESSTTVRYYSYQMTNSDLSIGTDPSTLLSTVAFYEALTYGALPTAETSSLIPVTNSSALHIPSFALTIT